MNAGRQEIVEVMPIIVWPWTRVLVGIRGAAYYRVVVLVVMCGGGGDSGG